MNKIEEAKQILSAFGIPKAQQNARSALTLLALLEITEQKQWSEAKQTVKRIHDILEFIRKNFKIDYAENTRETIRRQTLHQFEQAGIVIKNPDNPNRPTNSPKTVYAVTNEALEVIRKYNTNEWEKALNKFLSSSGKLLDKYKKIRQSSRITVHVDNLSLEFSPGRHNTLQKLILTELKKNFFDNAKLLYVGDTENKMLYLDRNLANEIGLKVDQHNKLPDVIFYEKESNILFLIEAVTSHGPVSPKRFIELENLLSTVNAKRIYISAFLDFKEFKKHLNKIAWETEVWIAETPDHMVHFNGPKFFLNSKP